MKNLISILISFSLLIVFNSCNPDTTDTENLETNVMQAKTYEIEVEEVDQKIKENRNLHLIDVRTPQENSEIRIKESESMVLDNLADTIINDEDISFHDQIIVYCRSGNRSKKAYDILKGLGYTNVKSMAGGIKEWQNSGFETCSELNNTC